MCTGTLINQEWVLSAGHCVLGIISATIILGAHDVTTTSAEQQIFEVYPESVYIHPSYTYELMENDIALVKLPIPVKINGGFLLEEIYMTILKI